MKYISTRGNAPVLSFEDAMLTGLARDGGLYLPETIPQLSHADIAAMAGLPYEEIAFRVMQPFVGDSFSEAELMDAITAAYSGFGHAARAPLVQLGPNHHLLELFHGPTLAFKDFAMQLIGQLFQKALGRRGEQVTICLLYTFRAHETKANLVCRLLLEKKKKKKKKTNKKKKKKTTKQ